MSDNLKRYCAILRHLKQLYPTAPTGNLARHLCTLAALISGIILKSFIRSKSCHLPAIAGEVPRGASPKGGKQESRSKRFARFLQNKNVTPETFFLPYAQALVQSLPPGRLVLVMDGSVVGRGGMALMLSVLYQCSLSVFFISVLYQCPNRHGTLKRALPLCWLVTQAPKGHFTQERHQELLAQAKRLIPAHREVIFLGDGEFDGCNLLADIEAAGWHYVCRTAKNILLRTYCWPKPIGPTKPSRPPSFACSLETVWRWPRYCSRRRNSGRFLWARSGREARRSRCFW